MEVIMMEKFQHPTTVRGKIRALNVGESVTFSGRQITYVRVQSSAVGMEMDRTYRANVDRENHTIVVTRTF